MLGIKIIMEILKKGSKGSNVVKLQLILNLYPDGIFGILTELRVKEFLKENNLTPDGVVGDKTWLKLIPSNNHRRIDSIIIHCSATPEGKDFTIQDIKRWHLQRGFSDIGYHWVIYRNGAIYKGRDESIIGAHCENHNSHSIGICYIGGVDANGKAKDTRTINQKLALVKKVKQLLNTYNLTSQQVHCHNEYSNKACPSFKIEEFRKELI